MKALIILIVCVSCVFSFDIFTGQISDPVKVKANLDSIQKSLTKGDFETTADYEKRISSCNFNDTMYFMVDSKYTSDKKNVKYTGNNCAYAFDADDGKYKFHYDVDRWFSTYCLGIYRKKNNESSYIGSNAFGVKTTIYKESYTEIYVSIDSTKIIETYPNGDVNWNDGCMSEYGFVSPAVRFESDTLSVDNAKAIKGNVSYIIEYVINGKIGHDSYHNHPTISSPFDITTNKTCIHGTILKVIAIKTNTKEIIGIKTLN